MPTHRPLCNRAPQWDWATRDGAQAIAPPMPYPNVTMFHGRIHRENHHRTGHIAHRAAKSPGFPLPAPGSQPERTPLPWDMAATDHGLGWRAVRAQPDPVAYRLADLPLVRA